MAWLFGASLAVGMWIHLDFAYLMPAPAVIFGLYMVLFQAEPRWPSGLRATPRWLLTKLRDPLLLYGLLPAAVVAAGLVAVWYLPHWQALFALSEAVEMYWTGEAFGFHSVPLGFWWYALTSPGVISTVLAVLLAVGLVVCLLQRRPSTTFLVVTFLTIYAAFGLRLGDRAWFHFAPVLPIAAAIVAFTVVDCSHWLNALVRNIPFLTRHLSSGRHRDSHVPVSAAVADASQGSAIAAQALRPRSSPTSQVVSLLSASLLTLCVGVAAFNFSLVTWGGGSTNAWSRSVAIALGAPLESGSTCGLRMNLAFCPNPARAEDWASDDILRVVLGDPECQARQCHLVLVPKIMDSFNSVVFDSTLVRDFPQLRTRVRVSNVDGYGGAPGDAGWVVSDYLVHIPEWAGARGREYRIGTAVTGFLNSQPPVFSEMHQEVASFPLPGGRSAKLLKRNQALTTKKVIQSYEEALLGVPTDIMLLQELGDLYLRVQNWSRAEQLFRQAAELDPALGWPHQDLGYLYQRQGLVE
ncbi:MAG: hypothetical protein VKI81_11395, partial [Synechococcaceae cyanobacterium]|nr:hypothetical protein [Synechococcaceae cyanobacterium]